MAGQDESNVYRFAGFTVDVTRRQLLDANSPVGLTSKAFETLLILIDRAGSTVSKSELMNAVWADTAVEENNLTQQISALRRALGERPDDHRFIVTVPGNGYKFVADVEVIEEREKRAIPDIPRTSPGRSPRFDTGALRGSAIAVAYIALMALSFIYSIIRNYEPGRPQSLAVLNFKVSATGDEFIGDGISYTLRARLGSVQDLTVRPGDAVSADQDALAAGRRLHVDTVVTGFVQRDHDRIRVAVEMLDVAAGRIIWGRTFDESASNLFALQDSIAGEVAHAMHINFAARGNSGTRPVRASGAMPAIVRETFGILGRRSEKLSV